MIWTSPSGHTYVTTPGSALLFPALGAPTGEIALPERPNGCTDRAAMMPRRRHTRAENRANSIAAERRRSSIARRIVKLAGLQHN